MYHHQQTGSSYDYPSYPNTPFEHTTAPPAQASGRAVRPSTSQTQSPPQQPGFQPPSYASATPYPSAPYNISSTHAQQWQQESWASPQYAQPFPASQSMQAEMTYTSTAAPRTDASAPISTPDARGFPPSNLPQPHEPRRQDSAYTQSLPASPRTRRRERDSSAIAPAVATGSAGPDFAKMQESYRLIMDNASNMMTGGALTASRSPAVEAVERMLQSANFGAQMLQSATAQSNPDGRPTTTVGEKDGPASKRQKAEEHAQDGQTCLGCNATSTPEWRRGPLGPRTLCNACGLVYAKLLKKRARGEARSRGGDNAAQSSQQRPMEEPSALSSGGSEDEDSYGSQERRSDFGEHARRG